MYSCICVFVSFMNTDMQRSQRKFNTLAQVVVMKSDESKNRGEEGMQNSRNWVEVY